MPRPRTARFGDALTTTEFGATDDLGTLDRVADEADRAMDSWQNWKYYNAQSGGRPVIPRTKSIVIDPLLPPTPDNVRQDKLDVLARPFPRLIAGRPRPGRSTRRRRPSTSRTRPRRWTAAARPPARGPRSSFRRHYPAGYEVELEGARTVGQAKDGVLRLRALPRAERAGLRVTTAP